MQTGRSLKVPLVLHAERVDLMCGAERLRVRRARRAGLVAGCWLCTGIARRRRWLAGITFAGYENPPGVSTGNLVRSFLDSDRAGWYNHVNITVHDRGGYFSPWEIPRQRTNDLRRAFRTRRPASVVFSERCDGGRVRQRPRSSGLVAADQFRVVQLDLAAGGQEDAEHDRVAAAGHPRGGLVPGPVAGVRDRGDVVVGVPPALR